MKAISPFIQFVCLLLALTGHAHAERILFIGNSYTSVNRLPKIYHDESVAVSDD